MLFTYRTSPLSVPHRTAWLRCAIAIAICVGVCMLGREEGGGVVFGGGRGVARCSCVPVLCCVHRCRSMRVGRDVGFCGVAVSWGSRFRMLVCVCVRWGKVTLHGRMFFLLRGEIPSLSFVRSWLSLARRSMQSNIYYCIIIGS